MWWSGYVGNSSRCKENRFSESSTRTYTVCADSRILTILVPAWESPFAKAVDGPAGDPAYWLLRQTRKAAVPESMLLHLSGKDKATPSSVCSWTEDEGSEGQGEKRNQLVLRFCVIPGCHIYSGSTCKYPCPMSRFRTSVACI